MIRPLYGQCTKKGAGNDKQGKDAGNRTLCPYRNFSQAIKAMNKRKHPKWEQFKAEVTNKCSGKNSKQLPAKGLDYLTVQRLSPTVEGKLQKYTRMGPLRMVPMKGELTLNSIKKSCKEYFKIPDRMECDLLAGERGPSFTDVTQIKSFKLLHVRFMERTEDFEEHDVLPPAFSCGPSQKKPDGKAQSKDEERSETNVQSCTRTSLAQQTHSCNHPKASKMADESRCATSIPLSDMLKLGKLILPSKDKETVTVELEEFSMERKTWLQPFEVRLTVNKKPFASGAFRKTFEAVPLSGLPKGKYVLKKYREEQI